MLPSASKATGLSMWLSRFGSTWRSTLPSATPRRNAASSAPALSPVVDCTGGASMSGIEATHPRLQSHQTEQRIDLRRRLADGRADLMHRGQQGIDLKRLACLDILQHRRLERAELPRHRQAILAALLD